MFNACFGRMKGLAASAQGNCSPRHAQCTASCPELHWLPHSLLVRLTQLRLQCWKKQCWHQQACTGQPLQGRLPHIALVLAQLACQRQSALLREHPVFHRRHQTGQASIIRYHNPPDGCVKQLKQSPSLYNSKISHDLAWLSAGCPARSSCLGAF